MGSGTSLVESLRYGCIGFALLHVALLEQGPGQPVHVRTPGILAVEQRRYPRRSEREDTAAVVSPRRVLEPEKRHRRSADLVPKSGQQGRPRHRSLSI